MKHFISILLILALLAGLATAFAADDGITDEEQATKKIVDLLGEDHALKIVEEIKALLRDSNTMTDEALRKEIQKLAAAHNIKLTDGQAEQLLGLCRSIEKLQLDELKEKIQSVKDGVRKLQETKEKAAGVLDSIKNFFQKIRGFFSDLLVRFQ